MSEKETVTIEIYWDDLTEEKQKEILQLLGDNGNFDVYPIATLEIEPEENGFSMGEM